MAGRGLRPHERRVFALQPLTTGAAGIAAADAFRHDAFQAQLARLGEDQRTLGLDCLAEEDALDASDKCLSAFRRSSMRFGRTS
jgi:hypothetical protein